MDNMRNKLNSIFKQLGFIIVGVALSILLILISELTKFSHANLIPFGGPSWATWVYPLLISIGFLLSAFIFRVKKSFYIFIIIFILISLFFYYPYNMSLFTNPIPFGANAI